MLEFGLINFATACVLGASVICIDKLVRLFPGKKNFRIQDSDAFLASSLSLSFGVMVSITLSELQDFPANHYLEIFMSLYSMLPEARSYLQQGGFKEQQAGFLLMGCFVGGFVGIQVVSRLFHHFLPSHVVDCDHTHDDQHEETHDHTNGHCHNHDHHPHGANLHKQIQHEDQPAETSKDSMAVDNGATESTPLLSAGLNQQNGHGSPSSDAGVRDGAAGSAMSRPGRSRPPAANRRPSLVQVITNRVASFAADSKANCDVSGPCRGFSDPCGQECFKALSSRSSTNLSRPPMFVRRTTLNAPSAGMRTVGEDDEEVAPHQAWNPQRRMSRARSHDASRDWGHAHVAPPDDGGSEDSVDLEAQHHHHVPENAFLAIGLQTSIAIALHKFPEGFITYTTNHANPSLGFNVFLALFVHNISEGFAMALPLYMALNSRWKAMGWSFVLGGLSQPFGAGFAVLWFKIAKHTHMTPDNVAYGCLFAVTAGIMASVALQLFVESLSLNHNRNLSIVFAFLGMALLGLSSAFTSHGH